MPGYQPKEGSAYQGEKAKADAKRGALIVIFIILAFIVALVSLIYSQMQGWQRKAIYMRSCIEYHGEDICQLYWKYDRPDLGLRK